MGRIERKRAKKNAAIAGSVVRVTPRSLPGPEALRLNHVFLVQFFRHPMSLPQFDAPNWLTRLIQGVLGILGLYAALRLLPRVLRAMTRRFVFGLVGEILLVAVGLFLTRRAAEGPKEKPAVAPRDDGEHG